MTLPGKITLCELEEDNPQRSYFRVRPLLSYENGAYERFTQTEESYPDEGGIRIVPDKNEAMHFKSRMRTLGGYCLMDLVRHPNENEKIRPNKNYSPERGENNRNIVYSDVIVGCGELDVMQVLTPEDAGKNKIALTHRVLLRDKGKLKGPYVPELTPDRVIFRFSADLNNEPVEVSESELQSFERGGEPVELYISNRLFASNAAGEEIQPRILPAEKPASIKPIETKSVESKPIETNPVKIKPADETPIEAQANAMSAETDAAQTAKEAAIEATVEVAIETAIEAAADTPIEAPIAQAPAKPEAVKSEAAPAAVIETELNADEQESEAPEQEAEKVERRNAYDSNRGFKKDVFEGQLGLNPRRGKSLSEVVDFYWRQSRIERLGAEVSPSAVSSPVVSPVQQICGAFKQAWQLPEGRQALLKELSQIDELKAAFTQQSNASKAEADEEFTRLEAERLKLLRDIDQLKLDRIRKRSELMEETRQAHAAEIAELEQKEQRLRDECQSRLRAAQNARQTQAEAERMLSKESRQKLDSEFLHFAMFTKAASLIKSDEPLDIDDYADVPKTCELTGAQMISDLRSAFEAGGIELSNDEALNYLACLAIGSMVIFSGPTGCGKSYTAYALAGAMGLTQKGAARFARLDEGMEDVRKSVGFKELMRANDLSSQRFMLLEDININQASDQSHGLLTFADRARDEGITLMMTCLDDQIGYPLQPRLLDRAFLIRLKIPEYQSWQKSKKVPSAAVAPSLESVRRVFLSSEDVPAEVSGRMDLLVRRLNEAGIRLTPRALSDMYMYCAAVCPLMTGDVINALDMAFAQRALPHIMATAKRDALTRLPEILCDLPASVALLNEPIALPPM